LNSISRTTELLSNPGKKIVILIHVNPDGDAMGSSLGLYSLFTVMGHSCSVISPNDYPVFLKWMPGNEHVVVHNKASRESMRLIREAELIFAVDFNELTRVKELNEAVNQSKAYKIMIDHHPEPNFAADYMMSDISASSTAELVYRFIGEAGYNRFMNREIASCLFTGIMTDTGCFSYNSSNRRTWEIVAELLGYQIDKDRIYALTYDNFSEHRMRLQGYSLNEKMEVLPEYSTGYIWLSKDDLKKYRFEPGDTEGFVNMPLSIKGIRFSALFIEKDNNIRISFRSKGDFAVNEFSQKYFNGGGHRNASGGESNDSLTNTIKRFRELLPFYKDKLCDNHEN
jgi:bifunctional oligoribonuclease and PAP phosphatase NrnA